jgi:hypothetical protein
MTFFQELKRRNVIRVGALYLVAAAAAYRCIDIVAAGSGMDRNP